MNSKFLLCILTSSNEKLLKVSYESALNQNNHNLDYTILIVVNSLNWEYYKNVCDEFKDTNVEIIETQSNGKPGMGHNSVINIFKKRIQYDYLLLLDGDDFLYPSALEQLEKCFKKEKHIDMICLKSTDKLKYIEENNEFDFFDINLNNNFTVQSKIYVDYKLYPWNKEHMQLSNFYQDTLCTPVRLFLLHRNIFNYHNTDFFQSECSLYDDYLTFLYFIRYSFYDQLKCFIIPGKYIYLYNSININSVTHNSDDNDIEIYKNYKHEFSDCINKLPDWDLTKLPTLYISHKNDMKYEYTLNEDTYSIGMNINYADICKDANYQFIKKHGLFIINKVIQSYYDICVSKFSVNNFDKSLFYGQFFNNHNIRNAYISFIILYSIHRIHTENISDIYVDIFKKNKNLALSFIKFYDIDSLNGYIQFIDSI